MIRKTTTLIVMLIALMLSACAENEAQKRISTEITERAQECPIHIAPGISITDITYQDNIVTYHTLLDMDQSVIEMLKSNDENIKQLMSEALKSSMLNGASEELKLCREAGAKIQFSFTTPTGGNYDLMLDNLPE